jgi:PAS domain S-box-containing protein
MLGFTVEEGLARTVEESVTPASFNNAMTVLAEELELNTKGQALPDRSIKIENELFCKDGSTVWTEAQVSFMYDSKGQPKGIIGATRDISERKKAEIKLKKINEWLEEKVEERTAEIQEKNVALKVLLEQRKNDKKNLEESIMSNVNELLIPNINRLKSVKLTSKQQTSLNVLESNLNEICSPFANKSSSSYMKLTPTEIQIVNFIKHGMSSKDIAESLSLSQRTIDSHRYNIRKKLGVSGKGVNLRTYLLSLS